MTEREGMVFQCLQQHQLLQGVPLQPGSLPIGLPLSRLHLAVAGTPSHMVPKVVLDQLLEQDGALQPPELMALEG